MPITKTNLKMWKKLKITDVDFPEGRDHIGKDEVEETIETFPTGFWDVDIMQEFAKSHDCDLQLTHKTNVVKCNKKEPKRGFYILDFLPWK